METLFASAVAVTGTLLGVLISQVFQRRQYQDVERTARLERRRAERIEAISAFAEAAVQFRRTQYDRWWRRRETADGLTPAPARDESYRMRAAAWQAFFRLKLVGDDTELARLAADALEVAAALPRATSEEELGIQGEHARGALDAFVDAAAAKLRDPG